MPVFSFHPLTGFLQEISDVEPGHELLQRRPADVLHQWLLADRRQRQQHLLAQSIRHAQALKLDQAAKNAARMAEKSGQLQRQFAGASSKNKNTNGNVTSNGDFISREHRKSISAWGNVRLSQVANIGGGQSGQVDEDDDRIFGGVVSPLPSTDWQS